MSEYEGGSPDHLEQAELERLQQAAAQQTIIQGRPEHLRQAASGMSLGRMFSSTMAQKPTASPQQPGNTPTTATAAPRATEPSSLKQLTGDELARAWMAFAMTLPENERALSDRMKIIVPTLKDNSTFGISVDNQLVAEMFESEAKRICAGMSAELGGALLRMSIDVNKVVVERHVYDRTKQFEILRKKNPLLNKLHAELSLELS